MKPFSANNKFIKYSFFPILTASTLLGTGCEASKGPEFQVQTGAGTGGDSEASVIIPSCTITNQTQPCSCGSLPGRQNCLESEWSPCECLSDDDGPVIDLGGRLSDGGVSDNTPEGNRRADLKFDWARTVPLEGECKPGRYEGSYECTTTGPVAGMMPEILVTGQVAITLEKSSNGEFLEIVDGSLEGIAQDFAVPFTSGLEGQLDCATNEFKAVAVDGSYIMFVLEGKFHGDLLGEYNRLTSHLSGEWFLSDDLNGDLTCDGPWSADFVSP